MQDKFKNKIKSILYLIMFILNISFILYNINYKHRYLKPKDISATYN